MAKLAERILQTRRNFPISRWRQELFRNLASLKLTKAQIEFLIYGLKSKLPSKHIRQLKTEAEWENLFDQLKTLLPPRIIKQGGSNRIQ